MRERGRVDEEEESERELLVISVVSVSATYLSICAFTTSPPLRMYVRSSSTSRGWVGGNHQGAGNVHPGIADGVVIQPLGLGEAEEAVVRDVHFVLSALRVDVFR